MEGHAVVPHDRGTFSLAIGDALVTAFFVTVSSTFDQVRCESFFQRAPASHNRGLLQVGNMVAPALGLPPMAAGLLVLILGLITFLPVCDRIGGKGALFNPAHNIAFAAMRQGSVASHIVRMVGHMLMNAASHMLIHAAKYQNSMLKQFNSIDEI